MRTLNIDKHILNRRRSSRQELVRTLKAKGIKDEQVLAAIYYLPRELFVLPAMESRAYEDTALPIDKQQTISQPYTVAYMTELLDVKEGDKILEIGTGSGYQAALLYLLGADVYSVERIPELYENCKVILSQLGAKVNLRLGDGSLGWNEKAPFDSIIVTAAAPEIPNKLILQLKTGGKMVVPVGDRHSQDMFRIIRQDEEHYVSEQFEKFTFVPLIGANGWANK